MTTLEDGAEALTATLVEERRLYASLLALAGREERAIVAGDVEELTELTEQKEQLIELLATLETERMTALAAIAAAVGVDADGLTLSGLGALLPGARAGALLAAGSALREQALELREVNERNAALLRGSRELVERWIQYLKAIVSGSLTYTAGGSPNEAAGNRVLDRSA